MPLKECVGDGSCSCGSRRSPHLPTPHWPLQVAFLSAMGPLGWAIVAWRNSLVFHDLEKVCGGSTGMGAMGSGETGGVHS